MGLRKLPKIAEPYRRRKKEGEQKETYSFFERGWLGRYSGVSTRRPSGPGGTNMSWSWGRTSQAGEAVWLGPCPWAARRWARRRRRGYHRSHIVPLGRVPPPATPWGGPVAEAREESRRATRWTCHDLESRTTERQARHTSMQARPATESYWVLTSYHVPITP